MQNVRAIYLFSMISYFLKIILLCFDRPGCFLDLPSHIHNMWSPLLCWISIHEQVYHCRSHSSVSFYLFSLMPFLNVCFLMLSADPLYKNLGIMQNHGLRLGF
jgi:hypothetical protein